MYEKFGFTVRLAWNWRDEYLANANVGCCNSPIYVEPYEQIDLNIGYEFTEHFAVSLEALNITEEDVRWHGRTESRSGSWRTRAPATASERRYKF